MLDSGWGRIVVIASVVAKRGESQVSAYTASKHGVLGLVRTASAEVAGRGVTVNAVCPGYVDAPMTAQTVAAIGDRTGRRWWRFKEWPSPDEPHRHPPSSPGERTTNPIASAPRAWTRSYVTKSVCSRRVAVMMWMASAVRTQALGTFN